MGGTLRTAGSIFSGGNLTLTSTASTVTLPGTVLFTNTNDTAAVGSGSFVISSGISVAQTARFGGNMFITGTSTHTGAATFSSTISSSGNVSITAGTISTNATSGALVVTGGFGLSGAMNLQELLQYQIPLMLYQFLVVP